MRDTASDIGQRGQRLARLFALHSSEAVPTEDLPLHPMADTALSDDDINALQTQAIRSLFYPAIK